MMLTALGRQHRLSPVIERVLIWWAAIGVLWIAGGAAAPDLRLALWLAAVGVTLTVTWIGFPLPFLGHSHTADYTIAGAHIAERCYLFVTIALGEGVLITGSNFGDLMMDAATSVAFVSAFVATLTLWWIYFDRAEEAGVRVISQAEDPGRLGLTAYTYVHILIVAGIIVAAAADEIAIAHPHGPVTVASGALIIGGPAMYLAGHALFKWTVWHRVSVTRLGALAAFAVLVPVALVVQNVALHVAATLILLGVVGGDMVLERRPGYAALLEDATR